MQLSPSLNTIDSPVATEVILLSLVDGTITGTNFRTFAWIVYPGATGYTFQLSATPCLATSPGVPVATDSLGKKLWPDGISLRPHSEDEGHSDVSRAGRDRGNRLDSGILPRTTSSELTPFRGAARIKIGY